MSGIIQTFLMGVNLDETPFSPAQLICALGYTGNSVYNEIAKFYGKRYVVNLYLLDVADTECINRLKKRNTYSTSQGMLNWGVSQIYGSGRSLLFGGTTKLFEKKKGW